MEDLPNWLESVDRIGQLKRCGEQARTSKSALSAKSTGSGAVQCCCSPRFQVFAKVLDCDRFHPQRREAGLKQMTRYEERKC
jgi:hypothetical protein